jgi:hypothetical protein
MTRDIALALPLDETIVGESQRRTIVLPWLPKSKNAWGRMDPVHRGGLKKRWIRRIVAECEALDLPKRRPYIGLCAVLYFATNRQRDPQNYSEMLWNVVPDALEDKQHGWLTGAGGVRVPVRGYGLIPDDREGRIIWPENTLGVFFKVDPTLAGRTLLHIGLRV